MVEVQDMLNTGKVTVLRTKSGVNTMVVVP